MFIGLSDVGGLHCKCMPRGYHPQHPNADYLLFDGLYGHVTMRLPKEARSKAFIGYCMAHYKKLARIHGWFVSVLS